MEGSIMRISLKARKLTGFLFVSAAGTFLHFLYDITGENIAAGLISAVNESIWEHMKLIFYPMVLFSLAESVCVKGEKSSVRCGSLAGILLALVLIPVLYYTYTGISGVNADWLNVTIFFLAAGAAFWLAYRLEAGNCTCQISFRIWWGVMILIAVVFTVATFAPPHIPLFRDALTGTYGIRAVQ